MRRKQKRQEKSRLFNEKFNCYFLMNFTDPSAVFKI